MTGGESTPRSRGSGMAAVYHNVESFGLQHWYNPIQAMTSAEWFAQHDPNMLVDMFFIDGYHPGVRDDMRDAWQLLRKGGVMVCHDHHIVDPGFFWLRDLIDSTGLPGEHWGGEATALWRGVKP